MQKTAHLKSCGQVDSKQCIVVFYRNRQSRYSLICAGIVDQRMKSIDFLFENGTGGLAPLASALSSFCDCKLTAKDVTSSHQDRSIRISWRDTNRVSRANKSQF